MWISSFTLQKLFFFKKNPTSYLQKGHSNENPKVGDEREVERDTHQTVMLSRERGRAEFGGASNIVFLFIYVCAVHLVTVSEN